MNIILFGPPGAGKGTQAKMLCEKYNLLHLSTGEILRDEIRKKSDLGKSVQETMKEGKLVSDEVIIKILNSAVENNNKDSLSGYLFDGFPRNIDQANLLSNLLDSLKIQIDCILLIEVDEPILLERILSRKKSAVAISIYPPIFNGKYSLNIALNAKGNLKIKAFSNLINDLSIFILE